MAARSLTPTGELARRIYLKYEAIWKVGDADSGGGDEAGRRKKGGGGEAVR